MSVKDWERDVVNRQRNIVFPDTNLNEGRFYRNIASGKAIFSVGQKVSLLLIVAFFIVVYAVDFAGTVAVLFSEDSASDRAWSLEPSLISLVWLIFWVFLAVKGLVPQPAVRKRRRGYRRTGNA